MDLRNELYPEQQPGFWRLSPEDRTFYKDVGISGLTGFIISWVAAEVSKLFDIDPGTRAALISSAKPFVTAVLLCSLRYRSLKPRYKNEATGETHGLAYVKDMFKTYASAIPAATLFYTLFTLANAYLMKEGMDARYSTPITYIPAFSMALPVHRYFAQKIGLLNSESDMTAYKKDL
ncbi:MAG: hypothetical protein NT120_02910 [Candidatus Aenigmarchaeota archaeon]|nr:hypothetical protein [Candidatus Aenigmarchaeota archaeon]